ncbi:hypothetical protein O181_039488 [Austropuccinia psidii MF-1]|uniref:Uncharacterized protein n=1 Tax=Austropuccinia psidii MF-1 TaxID=1389203 RepID=A0A9Q3DDH6_9BASI|nr:hypothetical protein [Austropuccinia psidii MF-1]
MGQYHGKHSWPWWKDKLFQNWANDYWRFKMENSSEEDIFNIERDRPMSWFLKQKERLTALHPDMSEAMVHKRILEKCGGDLEKAIRRRCIDPCSTEDYLNAMEGIATRTKIGKIGIKHQETIGLVGNQFQDQIIQNTELLLNFINFEVHLVWLTLVQKRQELMR